MDTLRIIGLDDDNHCPCFRCEDGTVFDRSQALIEFLSKPHDCQVEVKMFAIINQPVGGLEKYDMEQIDDMFYCMEGCGMAPEYISFEDMFNLFWNSANKLIWYQGEYMRYYRVTAHTMYCGEELTDYIATESAEELFQFKQNLIEECAAEWEPCWADYAEEGYDSEEDWQNAYYSDCGAAVDEITEAEYRKKTKPVWPFELVQKES